MKSKRNLSRGDTKLMIIKRDLLEPNRLITAFSPQQFSLSAKAFKLPHSKAPTVVHSRNESEKELIKSSCTTRKSEAFGSSRYRLKSLLKENIRYIGLKKKSLTDNLPGTKKRIKPIACVLVSKRPFGDHLTSGSKEYIHIRRNNDLPQIISIDRLKQKELKTFYK